MSSWARHSAVAGAAPAPPSALRTTTNGDLGVSSAMAAQRDMGLRTSVRILQDRRLNLIHIPLRLYGHFVQAILALVLPDPQHKHGVRKQDQEGYYPDRGQSQATDIINISVTEVECSIVCSKKRVERFFKPLLDVLSKEDRATVAISEDEFVAIQVDGEGLEAGQRVLDLTSPLAMAGVFVYSIFIVAMNSNPPQPNLLYLHLLLRLHPRPLQKHQRRHHRAPTTRLRLRKVL